jgi:hypothetical protein
LAGFRVDHQFELDRGLRRKLARLVTHEDAVGILRGAPKTTVYDIAFDTKVVPD